MEHFVLICMIRILLLYLSMVTHDMRSARRGNRILYLKDGSVLGECDLGKYVSGDRERHEKLSAFLEEMGW